MGTWARGYDDTVGSAKRDGVAVQKWKGGGIEEDTVKGGKVERW